MVQSMSLEAYLQTDAFSNTQKQRILQALSTYPNMTNREISAETGIIISSVSARVNALCKSGKVVVACVRCCGVSGKRVIAWKVKTW